MRKLYWITILVLLIILLAWNEYRLMFCHPPQKPRGCVYGPCTANGKTCGTGKGAYKVEGSHCKPITCDMPSCFWGVGKWSAGV